MKRGNKKRRGCQIGSHSSEFGLEERTSTGLIHFLQNLGLREIVPIREGDAGRDLDCQLFPDELDLDNLHGIPKS